MKVVKIHKSYRGGTKEHFLVLFGEELSKEDIDYFVEDWCNTDVAGSVYGYDYEWFFVEDKDIINKVLKDKLKSVNLKIESLQNEKNEIEKHLS